VPAGAGGQQDQAGNHRCNRDHATAAAAAMLSEKNRNSMQSRLVFFGAQPLFFRAPWPSDSRFSRHLQFLHPGQRAAAI
jgi:hypothetical protein